MCLCKSARCSLQIATKAGVVNIPQWYDAGSVWVQNNPNFPFGAPQSDSAAEIFKSYGFKASWHVLTDSQDDPALIACIKVYTLPHFSVHLGAYPCSEFKQDSGANWL